MPKRLTQRARNFAPDLYFILPFETKKKYNIRRESSVRCIIQNITDSTGKLIKKVDREAVFNVFQRDGRIYPPPELITELNLNGTEYFDITLIKLIRSNGKEIEIN